MHFARGKIKMKMHYRNEQKLWQNDHSNVIFLNCIYTVKTLAIAFL